MGKIDIDDELMKKVKEFLDNKSNLSYLRFKDIQQFVNVAVHDKLNRTMLTNR